MNERMRTIALLAHSCCVVVIGGYRGAYRGLSTHSSTGMTSSTPAAAAQLGLKIPKFPFNVNEQNYKLSSVDDVLMSNDLKKCCN